MIIVKDPIPQIIGREGRGGGGEWRNIHILMISALEADNWVNLYLGYTLLGGNNLTL